MLGPMAFVVLGGLVTSTLYVLRLVPWLYLRFGANAKLDSAVDELGDAQPVAI